MLKKPLNIILLGDPGAGKATQACRLVRKYKLYDLDMGKILRAPKNRKIGRYGETAGKGIMSPTDFVRGLFGSIIPKVSSKRGILFDGTPKMPAEARYVARLLQKHGRDDVVFIYLSIPLREALARRANRTNENGKAVKRRDDSDSAFARRFRYYRTRSQKAIVFFRSKYPSRKISGVGTREAVFERIVKAVEDLRA